ncbi:MAG: hypothetical protein HFE90_01545, partial [Firmicutes bacterium]|nr:hypothetical protein [Bacillota bacterium]
RGFKHEYEMLYGLRNFVKDVKRTAGLSINIIKPENIEGLANWNYNAESRCDRGFKHEYEMLYGLRNFIKDVKRTESLNINI